MRRLIVIGNSNQQPENMPALGRDDLVIRFNYPNSKTHQFYGGRTDFLYMANVLTLIKKHIASRILELDLFNTLPVIVLAYHPYIIEHYLPRERRKFLKVFKYYVIDNGIAAVINYFGRFKGFNFRILAANDYLNAIASLQRIAGHTRPIIPSTGFIALHYFLNSREYRDYQICIQGFSWQGWEGHDWDSERRFILQKMEAGVIHHLQ